MPAEVQIHEMSGLTVGVDKTNGTIRFKAANNASVDASDPINIPPSGSAYSYTKKLRAFMTAPPDTQVSNLRWYTAGAGFPEGVTVSAKNLGNSWGSNYITAMVGGADLFAFISSSPLDGDATVTGPFDPGYDENYIGDLIELQMAVESIAQSGTLAAKTLTFAYDEI